MTDAFDAWQAAKGYTPTRFVDGDEVVVCDNCGGSPITVTTDAGRFCDQPCADAYDLR